MAFFIASYCFYFYGISFISNNCFTRLWNRSNCCFFYIMIYWISIFIYITNSWNIIQIIIFFFYSSGKSILLFISIRICACFYSRSIFVQKWRSIILIIISYIIWICISSRFIWTIFWIGLCIGIIIIIVFIFFII